MTSEFLMSNLYKIGRWEKKVGNNLPAGAKASVSYYRHNNRVHQIFAQTLTSRVPLLHRNGCQISRLSLNVFITDQIISVPSQESSHAIHHLWQKAYARFGTSFDRNKMSKCAFAIEAGLNSVWCWGSASFSWYNRVLGTRAILDDPVLNWLVSLIVYAFMQACMQVCMYLHSVFAWCQVSV